MNRIEQFFGTRQDHSFLVLSWAQNVAYLLMDAEERFRPYIVVSRDGCAPYQYREGAERAFLVVTGKNKEIEPEPGFEVLYVDKDGDAQNFDFGVTYVAFFDGDPECLLVHDKFGDVCRCFRNRFQIPSGYLKFCETVNGDNCKEVECGSLRKREFALGVEFRS